MSAGEITVLLRRIAAAPADARQDAFNALVDRVYDELRRRARAYIRHERGDSLPPTALVNEVYQKLLQYEMPYTDRQHFFAVAGTAMRRLLIDRARRASAARRGARRPETTIDADMPVASFQTDPDLLLAINDALARLTPDQVRLTELRFFAGLTLPEAASVMGLNVETARKRWRVIKALLAAELQSWNSADG
jgi:RNA polymerase sigma factor (TIGR02999 family)